MPKDIVRSQGLLFDMGGKKSADQERDDTLMKTIDRINRSFGKDTMLFGSQGIDQKWRVASEHSSQNYTICFDDLPVVKAR